VNQNKSQSNACTDGKGGNGLKDKSLLLDASHFSIKFCLVETVLFIACPVSVFHVVQLGLIKSKIRVAVNALIRINFAVIHKAIPERQARQLFVCGYYFD
jgi:hypothetical protein